MELQQTEPKQPRYAQKTLDAMALVQAGLKPKEALKAVNYTNKISDRAVSSFNKKFRKHSLTAPTMVKLAHHAVKDCLTDTPITQVKKDKQGNEIIEEIAPTWTNKLAAAAMVYDRVEPVVRQVQSINIDITAINLDDYRNGLACDMQGVSTHNTQVIDIKGE
jgi:hypothetical protein